MFAHVTNLRYWKTERTDLTTCEDASRADTRRGLFCVADGAGTTLFSNIWADILVEYFIRDPLASVDLFEMEWWIRQAQLRYRELAPQADKLNWNARQKAVEQGAYATLATVRFVAANEQTARAELLAIGDSCVLINQQASDQLLAFPLQHPIDFDRAPFCVPSLLKNLNRRALNARQMDVTLAPGDTIILATDAVARWILNGGSSNQEQRARHAFQEVASKEDDQDWRAFIDNCRADQSIVDDDSTALIIRLAAEGPEEARLGCSAPSAQATIATRISDFEQAVAARNNELVAIYYGDGRMLQEAGRSLSAEQQDHARQVADAMREVLQAMREAVKSSNFVTRIEPTWRQYASLLMDEACAETIRKTLTSQGVPLKYGQPQPSPRSIQTFQPQPPAPSQTPQPVFPAPQVSAYPEPQSRPAQPFPGAPAPVAQPFFGTPVPPPEVFPAQASTPVQALSGTEPEPARSFVAPPALSETASPQAEQLRASLRSGTPQEKMNALHSLPTKPAWLSEHDQRQLQMAQRLLDALRASNDAQICEIYDQIETGGLRNFFSFTDEEFQRLRAARQAKEDLRQWLAIRSSESLYVSHYLKTYDTLSYPRNILTPEELRLVEVARAFAGQGSPDEQHTIQLKNTTRIPLFNELFFSQHHFLFTPLEVQEIELIRDVTMREPIPYDTSRPLWPPLIQVNERIIDGAQFFALFILLPLHARMQNGLLLSQQKKERAEEKRQQIQATIDYWNNLTDPYSLAKNTLKQLVLQEKSSQALRTESDKLRHDLEKKIQQILDEAFKAIKSALANEGRAALIRLSEQRWRDALLPIIQPQVLTEHLQISSPGQLLENWIRARQIYPTIQYYQSPAINAPKGPDLQLSWIFQWWFLRLSMKNAQ